MEPCKFLFVKDFSGFQLHFLRIFDLIIRTYDHPTRTYDLYIRLFDLYILVY